MDKDARSFRGLWALGFGFIEVGTITAKPQTGYPGERVLRLIADRAVVNRMGFPNPGAVVAAERLRRRPPSMLVGVNVGKSMNASVDGAGEDYRASVRELAPVCDYLVVNVSSPNTPGLREMQAIELLRPLVADVRSEIQASGLKVPILIKIGPDLADDEVDAVAQLAMELQLDGIVAVNTTVDRSLLTAASAEEAAALDGGGISGAPLKQRALEVLGRLYSHVGRSLVLVSVGGIETPDDTWQRILAGATLVQAHTGFMYGGPAWPRRVNREFARRLRAMGHSSIQEMVGAAGTRQGSSVAANASNGSGAASDHPDLMSRSGSGRHDRRSRVT
jgi:dihydroorotate dehydrogenase